MTKGIFAGMDEESFAKIKKLLVNTKKEKPKNKHKKQKGNNVTRKI
jgi:hypothetical protein